MIKRKAPKRQGAVVFEHLWQVEAAIDDMNPQAYQAVMNTLFDAGALDVTLTPQVMKKNRPAILMSVLSTVENRDELMEIVLTHTTSFGVRAFEVIRQRLDRKRRSVKTPWGPVKIKIGSLRGHVLKATPEYEECLKLAQKNGRPVIEILSKAAAASQIFLK